MATATAAQENTLESAASAIAQHLHHEKVVVFDVVGPGAELTPLGTNLADDVSASLFRADPKLRIEKRSSIDARLQKAGFTTEALVGSKSLVEAARALKADVAVTGTLSAGGAALKVALTATRVKDSKPIDSEEVTIPVPGDQKLLQPYFESALGNAPEPEPGKNGYSYPRCVFCPQAAYTQEALADKIASATVILAAVITPDGRASKVVVVKNAPDGLTESAIDAVERWRLAPSIGPDGNAAAVRQMILITFHLFRR